jgi:hypothetical protein
LDSMWAAFYLAVCLPFLAHVAQGWYISEVGLIEILRHNIAAAGCYL